MKYLNRAKHFLLDYARYIYYLTCKDEFKTEITKYRKCSKKKPKAQIKNELAELHSYWGCIPMQYYTQSFYSQDCELSLEEMKTHVPGYFFYRVLHPEFDNMKQALLLCENKIVMHSILNGSGIPTPEKLFVKKTSNLFDSSGNIVNESKLATILSNCSSNRIFIKPITGRGGKGIIIGTKNKNRHYEVGGKKIDLSYIKALPDDYIIESGLRQDEYISEVYPHSINTLRVVTKRDGDGNIEIVGIALRMGLKGMQIDNGSVGGIAIGIDKDSGKAVTEYARYTCADKLYRHPDTGFQFSQLQISNWDEIRETILTFSKKLVLINLVGWDIALTDKGPIVIEINTLSALDPMQTLLGGFRDIFVSGNPKNRLFS